MPANTIHHIAAACPAPVTHTIFQGVTYLTAAISSFISLLAGFGLGWYVKGRGFTGVKTDATNAIHKVESIASSTHPVA